MPPAPPPIRVLLVEDNRSDYVLTRAMLASLGPDRYHLDWAASRADGQKELAQDNHDVYLLDYQLEDGTGLDLMRAAIEAGCRKPMILVTAYGDGDIDIEAIHAGAADYIIKGNFDAELLERSIRYAMGRSQTLEALRKSEERYALAVHGANDAIWDWDLLAKRLYLSPRWQTMLGLPVDTRTHYPPNQLLGRAHGADRRHLRAALRAHLKGETPHFECEFRLRHADGRFRWVTARGVAVRDPISGQATRVAGSLADITERTLQHHQLRAIFTSMVEGVIAVDGNVDVLHINENAARMIGTTAKSAIGKPVSEVSALLEVNRMLRRTVIERREVRGEAHLSVDGEASQVIELRSSPLKAEGDAIEGAVIVLHDITLLRRLEQRQREFVASVSHELQTPLTAIVGMVDTLADDPAIPVPKQRSYLARIAGQCQRLSALVNDLLTLSRAESLDRPVDHRPFDLRKTVTESVGRLEERATDHGLALMLEIPEHGVLIAHGEEQMAQVIDNLLTNAIKYSLPGGQIWVRVQIHGAQALLEVEDTGIGIAPEHQGRIFDRFYRVDKARSRAAGGTGLGLAIVKNLVLTLDGHVSVESTPNRGSTFRVRLPVSARALAEQNNKSA